MLGNFDETVSVKDFLHHADTGIGTCAGLDGEAVFEDGVAYKATADGKVIVMKPEDGVAFGTVAKCSHRGAAGYRGHRSHEENVSTLCGGQPKHLLHDQGHRRVQGHACPQLLCQSEALSHPV